MSKKGYWPNCEYVLLNDTLQPFDHIKAVLNKRTLMPLIIINEKNIFHEVLVAMS
jgi:hypothetical protein